jgi:hypothetical protein
VRVKQITATTMKERRDYIKIAHYYIKKVSADIEMQAPMGSAGSLSENLFMGSICTF